MRKLLLWVSVLFLGACSPGLGAPASGGALACPPVSAPRQAGTVPVRVAKSDFARLPELQPVRTYDYNAFVWLELSPANLATLLESGVPFTQEDNFFIRRWDYWFDPLAGEPDLPQEQVTKIKPGDYGLYFIQVYGRLSDAWREILAQGGIAFIGKSSGQAFLVWMSARQARAVENCDFVRWVGVYHAAYRLAPELLEYTGIIENVAVEFYVGEPAEGRVETVIQAVQSLGGRLVRDDPASHDRSLWLAEFALPASALVQVAQLERVASVSYVRPNVIEELATATSAATQAAVTTTTSLPTVTPTPKPLAGDFDLRQALVWLYGEEALFTDANGDLAVRQRSALFTKKQTVLDVILHVSLDAAYKQGGIDKRMLLLSATPDDPLYQCHACPAILSGVIFAKAGNTWQVEIRQEYVASMGSFGSMRPGKLVRIGPDRYGARFEQSYVGTGAFTDWLYLVAPVDGQLKLLLTLATASGSIADPEAAGYTTEVAFVAGPEPDYFGLRLTRRGSRLQDGKLVQFVETVTYIFSRQQGMYLQVDGS